MNKAYFLGFDFGTRSIGVACGQNVTMSAQALDALPAKNGQPDWQQIEALITQWQPAAFVTGLPLNMDGSEQVMTARSRKFAKRLHGRFGLPSHTVDERLTTVEARSALFNAEGYRGLEKGRVDSEAARILLESWLQSQFGQH